MASAAVQQVIALASQLSDDDRRLVVDAIAPKESIAELADLWQAEIERRAEHVRSGASRGAPADEVFARVEAKLKNR
jgi:putative addiction module component (TIGR02574 family)